MKSKNVILDTNLWISFLITKKFSKLDDFILNGKIKLIFSEELIEEFITVTKRPKLKKYFNDSDIQELLHLFDTFGILMNVTTEVTDCRDPKDNFLLSLAVDSNADYLVTGDSDLLVLKNINKTKIVTWSKFINDIK